MSEQPGPLTPPATAADTPELAGSCDPVEPSAPANDECPPEERLVELASGRLAQPEADPLHRHLDRCAGCTLLVGELLRDGPRPDAHLGGALDRYLLLDELGRGGMGVVYAAFDPQLDRKVALKVVRPGSNDPVRAAARLLSEAQALARLSHPNVVTVYEARALGGRVFLAMELVPGRSLRDWLRTPRPRREVVRRFLEAGEGLCAAHDAGLVHGDFKPENALLGEDGRVRVTDFGLSREAPGPRAAELDAACGPVAGTPAYLAPEQWAGRPADARSDQFAFCVALWEALSGERPFSAVPVKPLLDEIRRGPPQRAGAVRIPARLRKLLSRGLRADPAERHPDLRALLTELRRDRLGELRGPLFAATAALLLAAGVAVGARGVPSQARLCGGALSALSGIWDEPRKAEVREALLGSGAPDAEHAWAGVELAFDAWSRGFAEAHTEACEATRVRGEQSERLLDLRVACLSRKARDLAALAALLVHRPRQAAAEAVQAAWQLPSLRECAETDLLAALPPPPREPAQAALSAEVEEKLSEARALGAFGRLPAALEVAQQAVARSRALAWPPARAEALYLLGSLQQRSGDVRAEESLRDAAWEAEAGRHDRLAARARIELVAALGEASRPEALPLALREAQAALQRVGPDPDLEANLASVHAGVLTAQDKCEEALPPLRAALRLADQAWDEADPRRARVLTNLGNSLRCVGDLPGALARHREALALRERTFGPTHPEVAASLNAVANVLFGMRDFAGALPVHRRSLAIREQALGPHALPTASARLNVGVDLISLGKNSEGRQEARAALAAYQAALGPGSPRLAAPLLVLGHVEVDLGAPREARASLERALKLLAGREDEQVAIVRFNLARALRAEGKEPLRARALAETSRAWFLRRAAAHAHELHEVEQWLGAPPQAAPGPSMAREQGPRERPAPAAPAAADAGTGQSAAAPAGAGPDEPLPGGVPSRHPEDPTPAGARTLR